MPRASALIGDLPFFVSPDSSDVWANPELFLLDERRRPRFVAGVPPDYFSAEGQLWGNPVYNWDALQVHRLSVVDRQDSHSAGSRRRNSPGSLPGFCGCVACASRRQDSAVRRVGARPRSQLLPGDPERTGTVAIYRRGPGDHHLRMWRCCAINFKCQARESYSSRSMATLIILIFRTILSATRSRIRARMTIRQLGNGMNNCPIPRKKLYGATLIASS